MGTQVFLSSRVKPAWVKRPYEHQEHSEVPAAVDVEVVDGILEAVHIPTVGVRFQEVIIAALNEKFGSPMSSETVIKQNVFGAKNQVVTLSWKLGGIKISFDEGDLNEGMILLTTAKSRYLKKAADRQKF